MLDFFNSPEVQEQFSLFLELLPGDVWDTVYSTALATLIAAEAVGSGLGLGMRIRAFNSNYEPGPMLLYIIIIGIIGLIIEKLIKFVERKLTGWQEKREI